MPTHSFYPLRFEPIYQYRLWGGRRLANVLSAPLPGDDPIGEAWLLSDHSGFKGKKVWGEVIEDRGSQITFSALGQEAPLEGRNNGILSSPNERIRRRCAARMASFTFSHGSSPRATIHAWWTRAATDANSATRPG